MLTHPDRQRGPVILYIIPHNASCSDPMSPFMREKKTGLPDTKCRCQYKSCLGHTLDQICGCTIQIQGKTFSFCFKVCTYSLLTVSKQVSVILLGTCHLCFQTSWQPLTTGWFKIIPAWFMIIKRDAEWITFEIKYLHDLLSLVPITSSSCPATWRAYFLNIMIQRGRHNPCWTKKVTDPPQNSSGKHGGWTLPQWTSCGYHNSN